MALCRLSPTIECEDARTFSITGRAQSVLSSLTGNELLAALALITLGGIIQGSMGFGFAFTAVPALLIIHPAALPATALLLALPMVAVLAYRERHDVDLAGFGAISVGRVFGTVAGVWLLKEIPAGSLSAAVGALLLLLAVLASSSSLATARSHTLPTLRLPKRRSLPSTTVTGKTTSPTDTPRRTNLLLATYSSVPSPMARALSAVSLAQ